MNPKIIHPVEYEEIHEWEHVVFLAGPIRWAENWRARVISLLDDTLTQNNTVFASPDRENGEKKHTPWAEWFFSRQRQWELYYLRKAIETGVVIFWLEPQTQPLEMIDGIQKKSYGAITNIELGQIMVTHPEKMIVGIHPDYNERSTLINDLQQAKYLDLSIPYDPGELSDFPVHDTLEEVCIKTGILLSSMK